MKRIMMMLAGLAFISATVAIGQEKTVGVKFGPAQEIGREEILFASIASICEDDRLNFYVLDRMERAVFKFSPEGRLLMRFGRKGQGPGDFQSPGQVVFTPRGELAVLEDLYYVSFLKTDGTFVRRLDLNGRLGLGFIGLDRYYGWIWRPEDQQQVLVDAENTILKTFHTCARDRFSVTLPDETGRPVMFNYSHDSYVPRFLYAHGGRLSAVGISDHYEVELLDERGQTVATIRRDLRLQKFNSREKDRLEREVREFAESKGWPDRVARELGKKIPPHKNMIQAVRISPQHVFVFRFPPDISAENSPDPVDIFARKDEFLGTAEFPNVPLFISSKTLYFVKTDESGNVYLLRTGYSLEY
ncbi:MAG: 6-bladed beta-propeller [Candidatus Aminicenantales bacterium]